MVQVGTRVEQARGSAAGTAVEIVGSVLALATQTPEAAIDRRGLGPRRWRAELAGLRRAGFTVVDLVDGWLPLPDMTASELDDFGAVLAELGLRARGLNVSRCSVIDPERGSEFLEYTLRAVETTAALGLPVLSVGFHPQLSERHRGVMFWEVPSAADDRSDATWQLATERIAAVCAHAAERGLQISVELYEDSLVCTAADAQRLLDSVAAPNLGVNPDLGNTYRSATPQREPWLTTLRGCLPHLNYWHLKNYARHSASPQGPFSVVPTALGDGGIDYRIAVGEVLASGYTGPFVIEHYGGDALWMQERGRIYLERLVDDLSGTSS